MAVTMAVRPASAYGLWKATERPLPKLSNPSFCFTQSSPFHYQPLRSTSISRLNTYFNGKTSKRRTPIAMGVQMEEAVKTDKTPPFDDIPTVLEFTIPPESLVGFEADYKKISATWPADLATTTDDAKIEQFVSSAHSLVRRWLPVEVVSRLENFLYDPTDPPALVIRGLPIDKDLPPTEPNVYIKKAGKYMSETWIVGIARIVGQVFTYSYFRGTRGGMGLLVRELYCTAPENVDLVSAEGSKEHFDFHVDFFHMKPELFANVIGFMGIRGDRNKEGKTLLCNGRKLYRMLDPADIHVLRTEKITWDGVLGVVSEYVIQGPESNPQLNLFEENYAQMGGFDKVVSGSPEAVAAYKRAKEIASTIPEGVWLDGGDVLLLNQKKACHGRSSYQAKFDGNDRWLQRTYINSGQFWQTGGIQWPSRTLPFP